MSLVGKIRVIEAYKNKREPESVHILADFFWHGILILSITGAIAALAFNFWEFTDVNRALSVQPAGTSAEGEKLPFDKKELQTVVEGFEARKARYEQFSKQTPSIVDPYVMTKAKSAR